MKNKGMKYHTLSRRIVVQFTLFTLALSVIYGLFYFLFLYSIEDSFIEREVVQEASYLTEQHQQNNRWVDARNTYMTLYFSAAQLPTDLRQQFIDEPHRKEFYGAQGRHYHLYTLPDYKNVYLVAEVNQILLVRPIKGDVLIFFSIIGIFITFIAFVIAYLLAQKTAKPLKQLTDLVEGTKLENIPETFADQFPNNEIGMLASTLESSLLVMRQSLNREKCFTRDVSHELRTPVTIIKNALEIYDQIDIKETQANKIVSRITQANQQMEQTIITLLALAREDHITVIKGSVHLLPIIEQSIIDHCYLLGDKDVDVIVEDNCNVAVLSHKGIIKVLLDNVLSNAFQYIDKGEVSISFYDNKLTIEDTGPGIEQYISTNLTDPAIKGSNSTGYGFGLSIVKRLCEHQGWFLRVINDNGTKISISFED